VRALLSRGTGEEGPNNRGKKEKKKERKEQKKKKKKLHHQLQKLFLLCTLFFSFFFALSLVSCPRRATNFRSPLPRPKRRAPHPHTAAAEDCLAEASWMEPQHFTPPLVRS
jgi:hypothetical protein